MKKIVIKIFDKIILLLLGFSGIVYSCYKYGMLVSEYEIKGVVTDQSKIPIQNIQVVKQNNHDSGDTLYTNSKGEYNFRFWGPNTHLKFEDIDGEENLGEFDPIELNVQFTDADLVKKGRGNKTADVYAKTLDITLKRIDE